VVKRQVPEHVSVLVPQSPQLLVLEVPGAHSPWFKQAPAVKRQLAEHTSVRVPQLPQAPPFLV
jgi:hypothetical protein